MSNKAIIWYRVSTNKQEVESQKQDLITLAVSEGFKEDELAFIGTVGASAVKEDKNYQEDLQKLKDLIADDPSYNTVYTWEVSRLARHEDTFHKIKSYLVKNNIQLVIFSPTLRLYKMEKGKLVIDQGVEIALSLLATMAKQEIDNKAARSNRGRERNRKAGKFNGGAFGALYGYDVDKNGYIIPNTEEAKLVNIIFKEYSTGKYSVRSLAKEMRERGYTLRGRKITDNNMNNMLRNTAYIGYSSKTDRKYYSIIDQELWDKVVAVRTGKDLGIRVSKEFRHTHLATKVLKCPFCGHGYIASRDKYVCYKHSMAHRFDDRCTESVGISIEVMDNLLWNIAMKEEIDYVNGAKQDAIPALRKEMQVVSKKIDALVERFGKLDTRKTNILDMYESGDINKEEKDRRLARVSADMVSISAERVKYMDQLKEMRDRLTLLRLPNTSENLDFANKTEKEKKEIVDRHIKTASIKEVREDNRRVKEITIQTSRETQTYIYYFTLKDKAKQLKRK